MAHPLSEKAGLDLDIRVSTFLLEPNMQHFLSENAGLDLDMRVSTSVLEPKMAHSLSETAILDFLPTWTCESRPFSWNQKWHTP